MFSQYTQNVPPIKTVPGFWTFDAMAKYALTRTSQSGHVNNMFDKYYYDQLHFFHVVPGEAARGTIQSFRALLIMMLLIFQACFRVTQVEECQKALRSGGMGRRQGDRRLSLRAATEEQSRRCRKVHAIARRLAG